MSAILDSSGALGADNIRRYRTTCKVLVHSHENGEIDISQDVVSLSSSKNVKGVGVLNVNLVASKNYLNAIYPNDYINVYLNINDGEGWTRVFFGFVDLIKERYTVAESGEPTTTYSLKCSDFQKAFEKIQIYFNPYMSGRKDFGGEKFGTINIGGVALMTKGVRAYGSPANVVQNLIMMLLGFGTQFVLPKDYGANSGVIRANRSSRKNYLEGELGHNARTALADAGSFNNLRDELSTQAQQAAEQIKKAPSKEKALQILAEKYGIGAGLLQSRGIRFTDVNKVAALIHDSIFRERIGAGRNSFNEDDPALIQAIGALDDTSQYSLLDIIDTFSLFEEDSIDGWVTDTGIWTKQGSLAQILRSYSHEEINELYFDLRPAVTDPDSDSLTYSRLPDEIGGNYGKDAVGIQYIPHIIMREYPFGTITRLDGSDIQFTLNNLTDVGATKKNLGVVEIGALFSDQPNRPGRHTITQPTLSLAKQVTNQKSIATKHLDVAVISSNEIIETDLSRSDSDHFNLMEVYAGDFQLSDLKWMMADVLPLTTPINIMRHGLRTKTFVTRWAQFNPDITRAQEALNSRTAGLGIEDTIPTTPSELSASTALTGEEAPASAITVVNPVTVTGVGAIGLVTSEYGYRTKVGDNVVPATARSQVTASGGTWVFHNGVDIRGEIGTPVFATMDGLVVGSVPNGVLGGYGDVVIIKHTVPGSGILYSLYAHLDTRTVGVGALTKRDGFSSDLIGGGRFAAIPVQAGDQIGTVGRTNGGVGSPTTGKFNPHLHLEYLRKLGNRVYPAKNKGNPATIDLADVGTTPLSGATPDVIIPSGTTDFTVPPFDNVRTVNPQEVHAILGSAIPQADSTLALEEQIQDGDTLLEDSAENDLENNPTGSAGASLTLAHQASQLQGDSALYPTDTVHTRRQILRWGLLQDHWYQHNLEYVSGQIIMRGAPEIRVGYRLDIVDRRMSFYVDGVNHTWSFPNEMKTALTVSRGQSNNPFPMYVMPPIPAFVSDTGEQRVDGSRLSKFMVLSDPMAVTNAIVFRNTGGVQSYSTGEDRNTFDADGDPVNSLDVPKPGESANVGGKAIKASKYGEFVLYPETDATMTALAENLINAAQLTPELEDLIRNTKEFSAEDGTSLADIDGQDIEAPLK